MGNSLRAVIVIDFEAKTFEEANELDTAIQKKAQTFCDELVDPSNTSKDDLCIVNHKAGVLRRPGIRPFLERRGLTGSIHEIIFRGTRGPNNSKSA